MLNTLPYALVTAHKLVGLELHSALPGAPVQATPAHAPVLRRASRTRCMMASVLHRAAHVVAPA
ncbi:MAG: hypothetical protein ACXV2J_09130 [Actinomycetes bacterium]